MLLRCNRAVKYNFFLLNAKQGWIKGIVHPEKRPIETDINKTDFIHNRQSLLRKFKKPSLFTYGHCKKPVSAIFCDKKGTFVFACGANYPKFNSFPRDGKG